MTVSWGVPDGLIVAITAKRGCSRNARTVSEISRWVTSQYVSTTSPVRVQGRQHKV
jgi:hypothetical protein